jgi:ParB-like chromosome segregation protein Spo0J
MALADLNPAPYNPRDRLERDSDQYRMLKESLITFGNVQPIVVNAREGRNVIVGGHQRYWILHEDLGYTEDSVVLIDVAPEKEAALNVALNKAAGRFDPDKLITLLDEFEAQMTLELAQFTIDESRELSAAARANDEYSPTDFLSDEDIEATLATKATVGAAELKEDHPHRTGEQLFTMQLVFSGQQRETVMAAVNAAKEVYAIDTTMEAVVAICQQFLLDQGMGS